MSYTVIEIFDSRKLDIGSDAKTILMKWIVYGGDDASEVDIYNALCAPSGSGTPIAPYTMDGLNRNNAKADNVAGPGGIWLCEATYGILPNIVGLDVQTSFATYVNPTTPIGIGISGDVSGKSTHITQGLATIWKISGSGGDVVASGTDATMTAAYSVALDGSTTGIADDCIIVFQPASGWTPGIYSIVSITGSTIQLSGSGASPAESGTTGGLWTVYSPSVASSGGTATDFGNAIGVTRDGVAGTDIITPTFEFTAEGTIAPYTMANVQLAYALTGKINQATFWNFPPGDVLFQGETFKTIDGVSAHVMRKFSVSPSQYNLPITSTIVIPYKAGWDYLWVYYSPSVASGLPIQTAAGAYVVQCYQYGDFSQFGMG